MAKADRTRREPAATTAQVDKQELIKLYDNLNDVLAAHRFFYDALEGLALSPYTDYSPASKHGQDLLLDWLREQNEGLKDRFRDLIKQSIAQKQS